MPCVKLIIVYNTACCTFDNTLLSTVWIALFVQLNWSIRSNPDNGWANKEVMMVTILYVLCINQLCTNGSQRLFLFLIVLSGTILIISWTQGNCAQTIIRLCYNYYDMLCHNSINSYFALWLLSPCTNQFTRTINLLFHLIHNYKYQYLQN